MNLLSEVKIKQSCNNLNLSIKGNNVVRIDNCQMQIKDLIVSNDKEFNVKIMHTTTVVKPIENLENIEGYCENIS